MSENGFGCDLLVISPHTDDAEIGLGGTIASLTAQGRKVWVVDLTRGELGSNATAEERWVEAAHASKILGLTGRVQLTLPDGFVSATKRDHLLTVVWAMRTFRARWVVSAPTPDRHPDHIATAKLVQGAAYLSRLVELTTETPELSRWQAGAAIPPSADRWPVDSVFSVCRQDQTPSLLFNIDAHWETKKNALTCFASQFIRKPDSRPTMINERGYLDTIERRALRWGGKAGCRHAEAFSTDSALVVDGFPDGVWR